MPYTGQDLGSVRHLEKRYTPALGQKKDTHYYLQKKRLDFRVLNAPARKEKARKGHPSHKKRTTKKKDNKKKDPLLSPKEKAHFRKETKEEDTHFYLLSLKRKRKQEEDTHYYLQKKRLDFRKEERRKRTPIFIFCPLSIFNAVLACECN